MRLWEFITFLAGAMTWPHAGRSQQPNRTRRIPNFADCS